MATDTPKSVSGFVGFQSLKNFYVGFCRDLSFFCRFFVGFLSVFNTFSLTKNGVCFFILNQKTDKKPIPVSVSQFFCVGFCRFSDTKPISFLSVAILGLNHTYVLRFDLRVSSKIAVNTSLAYNSKGVPTARGDAGSPSI